ncbi:MAG: type IX secretion system membrane protein PorP/SprF [Flavobacteriaceae bacterium]|jgi:type IX secretion system PorP/SprF family membrane protein|nr:type IX secretion system membrane protein PorP/SprF [Flavobacteriaceae bacterium]
MKKNQYILTIVFLLLVSTVYGQQESNNTFYRDQMNIINPAYTGAGDMMTITMASRNQWQGVKNAPEIQSFSIGTPFSKNSGVGISLTNDKTFIEKQTNVYIDYSYKLKLTESIDLYMGLKAGGNFLNVDVSNLQTYSYDADPYLIDSKQFNPNMGAGAYLRSEKYYLSVSAPRLLNTERFKEREGIVTKATDKVHMYFSGGYDFTLSDNAILKPSVMVRYVAGAPVSTDYTATIEYLKKVEFGAAYRTDGTISGMAIFRALKWMDVGYAYESVTNDAISRVTNGTHEFFLKFNLQRSSKD